MYAALKLKTDMYFFAEAIYYVIALSYSDFENLMVLGAPKQVQTTEV